MKGDTGDKDRGPGRPIRIKDVAAAAGVSPSTVSYALRDYHRLSKETIKRVKAVAKKLGYKPSPAMSALAEHRWRQQAESKDGFSTLAVVHAYRENEWPGLSNRRRLFEALEKRAGELGYKVEVFDAGQTPASQKRLSQILFNRGIKGVFVAPHLYEDRSVPVKLDWSRFCAISILNEQPEQVLHAVLPSWVRNRQMLLRQFETIANPRVGVFVTETHTQWLGGLSPTFAPHINMVEGASAEWVPAIVAKDYDEALFAKWFKRYQPDIVVTNIEVIPDWIRGLGCRVPEDRSVVFIDTVQEAWRSGIDIQPGRIGTTASNLMHDMLRNANFGLSDCPYRLTVPGRWQDGQTFDPKKRRSHAEPPTKSKLHS